MKKNTNNKQFADFKILSDSNYDPKTNVVTIYLKNNGNKVSTGFENRDFRRIFEVSKDKPPFQGDPLTFNLNETYYGIKIPFEVKQGENKESPYIDFNISDKDSKYTIKLENSFLSATSESDVEVIKEKDVFITTTPLHDAQDIQIIELKLKKWKFDIEYIKNNHLFIPGKTYLFSADDPLINKELTGDTLELIDDNANPSNNYFVWSIPKLNPDLKRLLVVKPENLEQIKSDYKEKWANKYQIKKIYNIWYYDYDYEKNLYKCRIYYLYAEPDVFSTEGDVFYGEIEFNSNTQNWNVIKNKGSDSKFKNDIYEHIEIYNNDSINPIVKCFEYIFNFFYYLYKIVSRVFYILLFILLLTVILFVYFKK